MRILLTGSCGFIGTNLTAELLKIGHDVIGIDSLTDNYSKRIKNDNLNFLKQNYKYNFNFVEGDLINLDLDTLLDEVDTVFHLAGQPSVSNSWGKDFALYTSRNVDATHKLLLSAKKNGINKFVNSSSSSIYGRSKTTPTLESSEIMPVSPYGVTKLAAENLVTIFGTEFGLNTVSLRYFTVYGPRQRPDMAFNKLINAAMNNLKFPLHGDGSQRRDFTYVDDVISANISAISKVIPPGSVINIGGGSPVSMTEVIKIVESELNVSVQLDYLPWGPGNPLLTNASHELATKLLSWKPKINIHEGLKRQIEWQTQ